MRAPRLLYVEDDPVLRGVLGGMLAAREELDLLGSFGSAAECLAHEDASRADVALLDLDLGGGAMNGTELGLLLRERNPNMGIVVFTQHVVPDFVSSLPADIQWGWSFMEKRSDLDLDELVEAVRATARGLNIIDPGMQRARLAGGASVIDALSVRQREVLSLAASGLDAIAIAEQLGLAPVTVRQDLSKAYAILVPEPRKGTDLRTSAVLRYLRESRAYGSPYADAGTRPSTTP